MTDFYSRKATASIKKETTVGTPVIPNVFFGFNEEDISTEFAFSPTMNVNGNRSKNINSVKAPIPAPEGTITMYVEPKTFGHFLNGLGGGVTSGVIMKLTGITGTFAVGETITGGTSSQTAVVLFVGEDYLLVGTISGAFTLAETLTGGTSAATATLSTYASSVYGHAASLPKDNATGYSLQFNFPDSAIRYSGVRITGFDSITQEENIITVGAKIMVQSVFRHALVKAVTSSGAGAKTITLDQSLGLVATDTIKIWRPGTGFIDFVSAGVKTHTVASVVNSTSITVTNLETALAVGDILMLAPQTASYTVADEFVWIGGSVVQMGATIATLAEECIENFSFMLNNEYESRHCAVGNDFADRFPQHIIQKSLEISGTLTTKYENEEFMKFQRDTAKLVVKFQTLGANIGSTTIPYELRFLFPNTRLNPYQNNITQDDIVNDELEFTAFYDSTTASMGRVLLVNDVASY